MNVIRPIAETVDTVTLRRADFEALLEAVEDADDVRALDAAEARETEIGKQAARANHLPSGAVKRMMAGEHPVRIWREQRGLSQEDLASKAQVARSYLAEIEGRKKPGSLDAFRKLANALSLMVDDLLPEDETRPGA
jgi:ribosome-binding protein aMBF1 (putative translation factor)